MPGGVCPAADLAASKLYRCGEQDVEDLQFLVQSCGVTFEQVKEAVARLPLTEKAVIPSMVRDVVLPGYRIPPLS